MFAVTGITGQVGGAVARTLLEKGCGVRAVGSRRQQSRLLGKTRMRDRSSGYL